MKTQLATLVGWAMAALVPASGAAQIVFSPVVDVMVVYEGNAFAASPDRIAEANEIVISANNALQQSGLGERYDLVYLHTQPLPFSIAPGTTDAQVKALMDIPANASAITSLRNANGADLVVLVTEHLYDPALGGDHCGVAFSIEAMPNQAYRDIAYRMAVQRPCILSANANAHTAAAHELGHLLYLDHQLVAAPNADANPTNPVPYNHPHFSGNISTLMVAGPTVCGAGCAIANLHSDPQAT